MSRPCLLALVLSALPCAAKPWNGIEPGVTKVAEVVAKFGEASRRASTGEYDVLIYEKARAIKGTEQAQFRCDPATQRVLRIDVYPAVLVTREEIEQAYGPRCGEGKKAVEPCYLRRESDELHFYYLYSRLGLAVFFRDDGVSVQSMAFLPGKP